MFSFAASHFCTLAFYALLKFPGKHKSQEFQTFVEVHPGTVENATFSMKNKLLLQCVWISATLDP